MKKHAEEAFALPDSQGGGWGAWRDSPNRSVAGWTGSLFFFSVYGIDLQ